MKSFYLAAMQLYCSQNSALITLAFPLDHLTWRTDPIPGFSRRIWAGKTPVCGHLPATWGPSIKKTLSQWGGGSESCAGLTCTPTCAQHLSMETRFASLCLH
jgi:hypothetical protein